MKHISTIFFLLFTVHLPFHSHAQDMTALINKVKARLDKVNDYKATGVLKTDVAFIKAPISKVVIYYKNQTVSGCKKMAAYLCCQKAA